MALKVNLGPLVGATEAAKPNHAIAEYPVKIPHMNGTGTRAQIRLVVRCQSLTEAQVNDLAEFMARAES